MSEITKNGNNESGERKSRKALRDYRKGNDFLLRTLEGILLILEVR